MPSNLETRLFRLEQQTTALEQQIDGLRAAVAQLQQQIAAAMSWGAGGGGSTVQYYGCTTTGDLPAGSPGTALTGQTVWILSNGTRTTYTTAAKLYNDSPHDVPSGSQAILTPNADGSYTATGKMC